MQRGGIAFEALLRHSLDRLPHLTLVALTNCGHIVRLENVGGLHIVRVLGVGTATLLPLTLDLVKKCDVLVKFNEAQERNELAHDRLFKVDLDAEDALHYLLAKHLHLLLSELVVVCHFDCEWVLVSIVIQVDEAIVEKKARVALLAVRVVHLLAALNILQSLNDEALTVIGVGPAGLSGALMIKHVSVRDEAVCLDPINLNAKDSTADHHTDLRVLLE